MNNKQTVGHQVALALNPVRGYRDELKRKGIAPKDHARENARIIQQLQRRVQEQKRIQATRPETESSFKSKKYENVSSRVLNQQSMEVSNKKHDYLKRKSKGIRDFEQERKTINKLKQSSLESPKPMVNHNKRIGETRKQAVPKASELNHLAPRTRKNFVCDNARNMVQEAKQKRHQLPQKAKDPLKKSNYGKVPDYLVKRKMKWQQDEEIRRQKLEDDCPPGMVRVADSERLETLVMLQEGLAESKRKLQQLPLLIETLGQRRRKKELDDKIKEQEEAIRIFNKEKVFVYA